MVEPRRREPVVPVGHRAEPEWSRDVVVASTGARMALAAPPRPDPARVPLVTWATAAILSVLFPLAGATTRRDCHSRLDAGASPAGVTPVAELRRNVSKVRRLLVPVAVAWLFVHVSVVAGTTALLLTSDASEQRTSSVRVRMGTITVRARCTGSRSTRHGVACRVRQNDLGLPLCSRCSDRSRCRSPPSISSR